MSKRTDQMSELIRHELAAIIEREIEFPHNSLATISRATVSPDLREATIYITVIPDAQRDEALKILQRSARELRHLLAQNINARVSARLTFAIDEKELYVQEIDRILHDINGSP